jgi:hypothetical protein
MLRKKPKYLKQYIEDSYHAYGIGRLAWDGLPGDEQRTEADKLSRMGAALSVVIDRLEHGEYKFDHVERAHRQLNTFVEESMVRVYCVDEQCDARLEELRDLHNENVRFLELHDENDASGYEKRFFLSERYIERFIRMKELCQELKLTQEAYVSCVKQLADAYQSVSRQLDYVALRQFYAKVQAKQFLALSGICVASDLFRTVAALLELYIIAKDQVEIREARAACLTKEYHIESVCSLGRYFDFRVFSDETESPLMPEVVDLLDWPSEGKEPCHG